MVAAALSAAQVDADSISYVETHGTGTRVGDPIEITALSRAFRQSTERRGFCAVGSLKSNVGHLDAAAGVAGLIKTVLSLEHKQIPPSLHFSRPNPLIDFASSPFYVNTRLSNWETNGEPRRAGVTSLGIGGTNAHVVLEEAPAQSQPLASRRWQILTVSGKTPAALARASVNLADHLEQRPELALPDVAFTCHLGRKAFDYRRAVVSSSREGAIGALRRSAEHAAPAGKGDYRRVVFLFPGQGSQHVHMARGIEPSGSPCSGNTSTGVPNCWRPISDWTCEALSIPGTNPRLPVTKREADVDHAARVVRHRVRAGPIVDVMGYSSERDDRP